MLVACVFLWNSEKVLIRLLMWHAKSSLKEAAHGVNSKNYRIKIVIKAIATH